MTTEEVSAGVELWLSALRALVAEVAFVPTSAALLLPEVLMLPGWDSDLRMLSVGEGAATVLAADPDAAVSN